MSYPVKGETIYENPDLELSFLVSSDWSLDMWVLFSDILLEALYKLVSINDYQPNISSASLNRSLFFWYKGKSWWKTNLKTDGEYST